MNEFSAEVLYERLSGRVNGLEARLEKAEEWVEESKQFHADTQRRWAHEDGVQQEVDKQQRRRHRTNTTLLAIATALALYISIAITLFHR